MEEIPDCGSIHQWSYKSIIVKRITNPLTDALVGGYKAVFYGFKN